MNEAKSLIHTACLFAPQVFQEALSGCAEQAAGAVPSANAAAATTLRLPTEEEGEETRPCYRPEDLKDWKRKSHIHNLIAHVSLLR